MFTVLTSARKAVARVVAAMSCLALAACDPSALSLGGSSSANTGPTVDVTAPVQVALLIPKSDSGAGAVADSLEKAARLAVASLQGAEIDLRVYDTAGNPAQAGAQAQKAVDEGAKIIIGPLFAEAANAAGLAVADDGVNVLSFSNNTTIAGGNVFILGPTFRNTANRLMGFAKSQGRNSVVVVHPENIEGQQGLSAARAAAGGNGVTISGVESFAFSQEGVNAAVPRIKSAVDSSGADSVFLTSTAAGALPMLLQLLPEVGVDPAATQYMGLARWDLPAANLQFPGAQGGWFTLPNTAMVNAFESRYEGAYGAKPHPLGGLGFDAVAAIGALVRDGRRDALTSRALTQAAGFNGTGGVFRLLSDGTNQRALAVATVRNNQVVILDPAPTSFGGS